MYNDDPYSRQRAKAGGIGSAAQTMPPPAKLSTPQSTTPVGAPQVNDSVAPKLRRDASMYAPVVNAFSPAAAAAKLVDHRLAKSGQPMPSQIGPTLAQPPGPNVWSKMGSAMESAAPIFGPAAINAAKETGGGPLASVVRNGRSVALAVGAGLEAGARGAVGAAKYVGGEIGTGLGMSTPPTQQPNAPATLSASPMPSGARREGGKSPNYTSNSGIVSAPSVRTAMTSPASPTAAPLPSTAIAYTGDGMSGKANAAAPGQVGLSEKTQKPLPGAPIVGADGSVQYDDAFAQRNPDLMARYANQNVVQSVVPAPGVAQSMVSGQTPELGGLARAPQGFSQEDRMQQLDSFDRQGREYKARALAEKATTAAQMGNFQAAQMFSQLSQQAGGIQAPPRLNQAQRQDPNDAARLAMEQQRLNLDKTQAGLQAEGQQLKLQQDQQMQALVQKFMAGDKAAGEQLAVLRGTKPNSLVKVQLQVGTDEFGKPLMADGLWDQEKQAFAMDPREQTKKAIPQGYTPESIIAEAQKALATKPRAAVEAELRAYGLTLPGA